MDENQSKSTREIYRVNNVLRSLRRFCIVVLQTSSGTSQYCLQSFCMHIWIEHLPDQVL